MGKNRGNQKHFKTSILTRLEFNEDGKPRDDIMLLPTGVWNSPTHGHFTITEETLDNAIYNFQNFRKDVDINISHFPDDGAGGWFTELYKASEEGKTVLRAKVEWTKKGLELLKDKVFKFISPEFDFIHVDPQTGAEYKDVLVGAGLTNRPFFRQMPAVVASETGGLTLNEKSVLYFSDTVMNLEQLLSKPSEELTEEEVTFIRENEEELTDEQRESLSEVLADDQDDNQDNNQDDNQDDNQDADQDDNQDTDNDDSGDAEDIEASEKTVTIKASELKQLQNDAKQGSLAFKALDREKVSKQIESFTFSESNKTGVLTPAIKAKATNFMVKLSADMRKEFAEVLKGLKKVSNTDLFDEKGNNHDNSDGGANSLTASERASNMAEELVKEGKAKDFNEALDKVLSENAELAQGIQEEYTV